MKMYYHENFPNYGTLELIEGSTKIDVQYLTVS